MTADPHPEQLTEEQLVALAERALAILHARYSDEETLVAHFGVAAADDVRLALENAREGFDRFIDHYRETDARAPHVPVALLGQGSRTGRDRAADGLRSEGNGRGAGHTGVVAQVARLGARRRGGSRAATP